MRESSDERIEEENIFVMPRYMIVKQANSFSAEFKKDEE